MRIIIVGGGRVGLAITRLLLAEGHDITVLEWDSARAEYLATTCDVNVLQGRAEVEMLREAGAEDADLLIAVTYSDETNLIACAVGKKLGAKHTIARVREEEYYQDMILLREEMGLSMSINPERTAAKEMSRTLRFPVAIKVEPFAHGQVELVEYSVSTSSKLRHAKIRDFRNDFSKGVLVCALERDGQMFIPNGKFEIQAGDILTLVGSPEEMHKLFRHIKEFRHETRSVMLIGGGRLSERLGMELQGMHIKTTIVESDRDRCLALKSILPDADIVCGDGTQPDVLVEEGINDVDAVVALTESDAVNLVISTFAQANRVPQIITLLNEEHFQKLAESNGLLNIIQPPKVTAERIVEYVRWMQNSSRSSGIETLRMISNGKAEALEFIAGSEISFLNVPLKELPLKESILIAAITRHRRCIIPDGNEVIREGDHVVVVTTQHRLKELEDIIHHK